VSVQAEPGVTAASPRLALAPPPPPRLPRAGLLPPEQLTQLLAHYRRHGVAFDSAWDLAMDHVVWPTSRRDASEWRTSLNGTREGWRASYLRWETLPHEQAVAQLWTILSTQVA
jgi:hypothetical protein